MGRREFQFVEGSSSKFWAIELSGKSFTVTFGRIGTSGQAQQKDFASDDAAKKQYDKLIAEKVSKGYKEVGAAQSSGAETPTPVVKKATPKRVAKEAEAGAAPVAAPEPQKAVEVKIDQPRSIDLDEADWAVATWRPRAARTLAAPGPFDLEVACNQVAKVPTRTYGWEWEWSAISIPRVMSREEAHFWLNAMSLAHRNSTPKELAQALRKQTYGAADRPTIDKLLSRKKVNTFCAELMLPLANLVPVDELLVMMLARDPQSQSRFTDHEWYDKPDMVFGFQRYVLPRLNEAELEAARRAVAARLDPQNWPQDHYVRPDTAFFLAAAIGGLSDQLLAVTQQWTPEFYIAAGWDHTHYHQPQIIVFGLGDSKTVEAEMRRHKLPLNKPEYIRAWLATTEYAALDYVRDCILAISNKEEAEKLLREFARVHAPEAAPHMLALKLGSKAPKIAREWLDEHVGFAIAGLIPEAAGRGKLADAAIDYLRDLRRAGHGDAIAKAAGANPPERIKKEVIDHIEKVYTPFDTSSTPAWLAEVLADIAKPKLPAWLPAHTIPLLAVGEHRLSDAQLQALIAALQKSPLDAPHPLIKALREHAGRESRDAFAWRLFELWQAEGAPSKDKWAMAAIGHLGGDGCVLKLTPLVRAWPGESQHQRAVFGLECLRAIGSDQALMALNGIAQKLKFKGLKAKAMEFMDAIATQRGMSRAQLEDRIVPDCDLDERGTRVFDFGPRQFRLVLGADMKPMIKDAEGKVKGDLPTPNSKDNAAQANEAVATWKLLKKQVKEVAKVQAERLEQAMVTGRRWSPEEFDTLLVKHPLMINLVRLAVWAAYDKDGTPLTTFRVTEDQTLASDQDDELELPVGVASIGLVHPAHLSKESLSAWGQVFSDYELIPPFEQLGRRVNTLEGDEVKQSELKRIAGIKVEAIVLIGILERLAWQRGIPEDGGMFYSHSKPFPGANVSCVVQYEPGVSVGYITESDNQTNITAFFVRGLTTPKIYPEYKDRLPLSAVDSVVMSEVIRDLNVIASKAKE